jgi:hypothetical protein
MPQKWKLRAGLLQPSKTEFREACFPETSSRLPRIPEDAEAQLDLKNSGTAEFGTVPLRQVLASIFDRDVSSIPEIKKTYVDSELNLDPVDGLMIVSGKDRRGSLEDLDIVCSQNAEVKRQLFHFQWPGRWNRVKGKRCTLMTWIGIMMLSPSRIAGHLLRLSAKTLCRFFGGDEKLVDKLAEKRQARERLSFTDPVPAAGISPGDKIKEAMRAAVTHLSNQIKTLALEICA